MLICSICLWLPGHLPSVRADSPLPEDRFPVNLVNKRDSLQVQEILGDYSIYREHKSHFASTPKVYRYLLNRLPLAATLIRILNFGKYKVTQHPDGTLTVDNQEGLVLKVRMLHKSDRQVVSYVEGIYKSWWTTGIQGWGAIWLHFSPKTLDGRPLMENGFSGFIKFRNPVVDFVAKVMDFFLRRLTRTEIERSQGAGRSLSELMAKDPAKVFSAMQKSPEVSSREIEEFRRVFLRPAVSSALP